MELSKQYLTLASFHLIWCIIQASTPAFQSARAVTLPKLDTLLESGLVRQQIEVIKVFMHC